MGTEKLGADRGSSEPEPFSAAFKLGPGIGISEPGRLQEPVGRRLCSAPGHRRRSRNKFVRVAVLRKSKGRVPGSR